MALKSVLAVLFLLVAGLSIGGQNGLPFGLRAIFLNAQQKTTRSTWRTCKNNEDEVKIRRTAAVARLMAPMGRSGEVGQVLSVGLKRFGTSTACAVCSRCVASTGRMKGL